jgi:hypothetical protein
VDIEMLGQLGYRPVTLDGGKFTFALKAGVWFRRGRLFMVSSVHGDYRRRQAEIPSTCSNLRNRLYSSRTQDSLVRDGADTVGPSAQM